MEKKRNIKLPPSSFRKVAQRYTRLEMEAIRRLRDFERKWERIATTIKESSGKGRRPRR